MGPGYGNYNGSYNVNRYGYKYGNNGRTTANVVVEVRRANGRIALCSSSVRCTKRERYMICCH